MNKKQKQIFFSAYFSEPKNLNQLIQSKNDSLLSIPIPYDQWYWHPQKTIEFNVFEILRMNMEIWSYSKEKKDHAKQYYAHTQECIKIINNKFGSDNKIPEINYFKFYKLLWALGEDEEWYEGEFNELLASGANEIDIHLYNCAQKRNTQKVLELLKKGANPYIQFEDEKQYKNSLILDSLITELSFQATHYNLIFDYYLQHGSYSFRKDEIHYCFEKLYGYSSSIYTLDLIENFE
ncbi:MAG TPA: hypothetical protein VK982_07565 [Bacteroidales bacterium]|nr:hypothetical protein [Bacteroidales bacterium]